MTPAELKENLVKQYNETVINLQRLEGALAALNQLEETPEEETTED